MTARAFTRGGIGLGLAVYLFVAPQSISAQRQAAPELVGEPSPAGWSFTPSLATTMAWDDNVFIQGRGDVQAQDLNTGVDPGATLAYVGKRGSLTASYGGSLQMYRDFGAINNYAQSLNVSGRRRLSAKTLLFAQQSYSRLPTTEVPSLIGLRFLRLGAQLADFRGGIEATATKRLSYAASYNFQKIDFTRHPTLGDNFLGGHANGGSANARYQLDERTTLTADYSVQRATLVTGNRFLVQNTWGGVDYKLTERTRVFGAAGLARLGAADLGTGKTSPAWRGGLSHRFRTASLDVAYGRSFVPSYGGGGTLANEEVTSSLHVPVGRRWYADANVSWRRNTPLVAGDQALTSVWIGGTVGYAVQPWARIEGFYGGTHQRIDRPGGQVDRNRFGVQVVTSKGMRIR